MNKRKIWFVIGVVIIIVVVLPIFLLKQKEKQSEPIKQDINIGVILELTCPLSRLGERSKRGMEMATEDINAMGGVLGKPLKLIVEDDKSNPKEGVTAFQKLISIHKVPVVIGLTGSSIVMSCAPIANKKSCSFFSWCNKPINN